MAKAFEEQEIRKLTKLKSTFEKNMAHCNEDSEMYKHYQKGIENLNKEIAYFKRQLMLKGGIKNVSN